MKQQIVLISGRCLGRFRTPKVFKIDDLGVQKVGQLQLQTNFGVEEGDIEFDW